MPDHLGFLCKPMSHIDDIVNRSILLLTHMGEHTIMAMLSFGIFVRRILQHAYADQRGFASRVVGKLDSSPNQRRLPVTTI